MLWAPDRAEETVGAGGAAVMLRDFSGTNLGRGSKSSAHRKSGTDSTQWADRQWLNLSLASGQKEVEELTAKAGSLLEGVGSSGGPDSKLSGWASGGGVEKLRERQDLRDGTVASPDAKHIALVGTMTSHSIPGTTQGPERTLGQPPWVTEMPRCPGR